MKKTPTELFSALLVISALSFATADSESSHYIEGSGRSENGFRGFRADPMAVKLQESIRRKTLKEAGVDPFKSLKRQNTKQFECDNDGDGYYHPSSRCDEFRSDLSLVDCNDGNPLIYPDAGEICGDGVDNDCDTFVDESCPWYPLNYEDLPTPLVGTCPDETTQCMDDLDCGGTCSSLTSGDGVEPGDACLDDKDCPSNKGRPSKRGWCQYISGSCDFGNVDVTSLNFDVSLGSDFTLEDVTSGNGNAVLQELTDAFEALARDGLTSSISATATDSLFRQRRRTSVEVTKASVLSVVEALCPSTVSSPPTVCLLVTFTITFVCVDEPDISTVVNTFTTNVQGMINNNDLLSKLQEFYPNSEITFVTGEENTDPTLMPIPHPSKSPSLVPSGKPTEDRPTEGPSAEPSPLPSTKPSTLPSDSPTEDMLTEVPSSSPSIRPTEDKPTEVPSTEPSSLPSSEPSNMPSNRPTEDKPTKVPSMVPSDRPTEDKPTEVPSQKPSPLPSQEPSSMPSDRPTEDKPTEGPSLAPSDRPTEGPSSLPSKLPSFPPSRLPSMKPSGQPSSDPSIHPTEIPSRIPSSLPSWEPSSMPSDRPTEDKPTEVPSMGPSDRPTEDKPTEVPSQKPSPLPSQEPSSMPSDRPTEDKPTEGPSMAPSDTPTEDKLTEGPSSLPSKLPSFLPSKLPSTTPSGSPSSDPSIHPTEIPTRNPSSLPSWEPSIMPSDLPTEIPSETAILGLTFDTSANATRRELLPTDFNITAFELTLESFLENKLNATSVDMTCTESTDGSSIECEGMAIFQKSADTPTLPTASVVETQVNDVFSPSSNATAGELSNEFEAALQSNPDIGTVPDISSVTVDQVVFITDQPSSTPSAVPSPGPSPSPGPRAEWMSGNHGVAYRIPGGVGRPTVLYNADLLKNDINEINTVIPNSNNHVKWLIVGLSSGARGDQYLAPHSVLTELNPGSTPKAISGSYSETEPLDLSLYDNRDIFQEIITAMKSIGVKVIAYMAAMGPAMLPLDSNGDSTKEGVAYDYQGGSPYHSSSVECPLLSRPASCAPSVWKWREWVRNNDTYAAQYIVDPTAALKKAYAEVIVGEYAQRYGSDLAGFWFDQGSEADQVNLKKVIRAANPDAVIAVNDGTKVPLKNNNPGFEDYTFGHPTPLQLGPVDGCYNYGMVLSAESSDNGYVYSGLDYNGEYATQETNRPDSFTYNPDDNPSLAHLFLPVNTAWNNGENVWTYSQAREWQQRVLDAKGAWTWNVQRCGSSGDTCSDTNNMSSIDPGAKDFLKEVYKAFPRAALPYSGTAMYDDSNCDCLAGPLAMTSLQWGCNAVTRPPTVSPTAVSPAAAPAGPRPTKFVSPCFGDDLSWAASAPCYSGDNCCTADKVLLKLKVQASKCVAQQKASNINVFFDATSGQAYFAKCYWIDPDQDTSGDALPSVISPKQTYPSPLNLYAKKQGDDTSIFEIVYMADFYRSNYMRFVLKSLYPIPASATAHAEAISELNNFFNVGDVVEFYQYLA